MISGTERSWRGWMRVTNAMMMVTATMMMMVTATMMMRVTATMMMRMTATMMMRVTATMMVVMRPAAWQRRQWRWWYVCWRLWAACAVSGLGRGGVLRRAWGARAREALLVFHICRSAGAVCVLSSDWRRGRASRQRALRELASAGVTVIGCTPQYARRPRVRPAEILAWIRDSGRDLAGWCAIDDRDLTCEVGGGPLFAAHFVRAEYASGLTRGLAEECITRLVAVDLPVPAPVAESDPEAVLMPRRPSVCSTASSSITSLTWSSVTLPMMSWLRGGPTLGAGSGVDLCGLRVCRLSTICFVSMRL